MQVVPNPGRGIFHMYTARDITEAMEISLFNIAGKQVFGPFRANSGQGPVRVDLSDQPSGVYHMRIILGKRMVVKPVVVVR